jgi:hypothetical protein
VLLVNARCISASEICIGEWLIFEPINERDSSARQASQPEKLRSEREWKDKGRRAFDPPP